MMLGFVITNDKASYDSKEDCICLFSVAKEAALNKLTSLIGNTSEKGQSIQTL